MEQIIKSCFNVQWIIDVLTIIIVPNQVSCIGQDVPDKEGEVVSKTSYLCNVSKYIITKLVVLYHHE